MSHRKNSQQQANKQSQQDKQAEQAKAVEQQAEVQTEAKTESKAPVVEVTGVADKSVEGSVEEGEASAEVKKPLPQNIKEEKVVDYSPERLAKFFGEGDDADRIMVRIQNYSKVVLSATDLNTINSVRNNMVDILKLIVRSDAKQFIKFVKGFADFLNAEKEFGAASAWTGRRPFRPFLGAVCAESNFLSIMTELSNPATRKQTLKLLDKKALTAYLPNDKKDLFIQLFKEM